jgi:hypothetical protein
MFRTNTVQWACDMQVQGRAVAIAFANFHLTKLPDVIAALSLFRFVLQRAAFIAFERPAANFPATGCCIQHFHAARCSTFFECGGVSPQPTHKRVLGAKVLAEHLRPA